MKEFLKTKGAKAFIATYPELTYDSAAAIYLFTCESPLYKQLNQKLRERNRAALKAGFFPYTRLLFEGHRAMANSKARMLNRGVKKDLATIRKAMLLGSRCATHPHLLRPAQRTHAAAAAGAAAAAVSCIRL